MYGGNMEIKSYPRIKNAILLCLLFLGIQIGLGVIFSLVIGIMGISTESTIFGIGNIALNLFAFSVVILIGVKKSKQKFNKIFKFVNVSLDYWLAIIVFMAGFVIISSEIDNVLIYFLPMPEFLQDTFELIMVKQLFIVSIFLVGIIPGLTEEMLFRGIILNGLEKNYSNKKAILISALLFGIIHLNPWQFVTAFIIGVISAWICIKTKSIILCIYMHIFNNILSVVALKYKEQLSINGFNTTYTGNAEHIFQPIWFDIIGIITTLLGILLIKKAVKNQKTSHNSPIAPCT
jgi:membrane protease YdiL (CAAX protease family)